MKSTKASVAAPGQVQNMSPTMTNISGILESVMAFGRFMFSLNNIRARGEGNIVEEHARQTGS